MLFMFFTNQTQQPRTQTHHRNTNPATKNSNHKNTNQELTHHKNTYPATKTQSQQHKPSYQEGKNSNPYQKNTNEKKKKLN